MKKPWLAGLAAGVWLFTGPSAASAQDRFYRFERLLPDHGGTAVTGISSIFQDGEGFLWFGTAAGLARYDGYRFDFRSPEAGDQSLRPSVVVYPAIEDSSGEIWFGTHGEGLCRLDGSRRTFIRYTHDPRNPGSLSGDIVLALEEGRDGDLWIGTRLNGLNRFDRDRDSFTRVPLEPEAAGIWDLIIDRRGRLWVGTQDEGLYRVDPETGESVNYRFILDNPRSLGSNTVWTLFEDREGTIWIGTRGGGLNAYDAEADAFRRYTQAGDLPRALVRTTVTALSEDRAGRLWIGTGGDGLRVWDRKTGEYVVCKNDPLDPETIGSDSITAIERDTSGIMWVGTSRGGINKCLADEVKFRHFKRNPHSPQTLSRNDVRSLMVDSTGRLWIGLDEGLDRIDRKNDVVTRLDLRPEAGKGPASGSVQAILEDRVGRIWIGTGLGGLVVYDPRSGGLRFHRRDPARPEGLASNWINVLLRDGEDRDVLWVGTNRGLNRFDTRRGLWRRFVREPSDAAGLSGNLIQALAEGPDGSLWVGTNAGLNRMDKATGKCLRYVHDLRVPLGNGLNNNNIHWIHWGRDGGLWIGTDAGMNRFDPARNEWRSFTSSDGLSGSVVAGILEDGTGRLWLGTNRGLTRFDPETEEFTNYRIHDGIQDNMFNPGACHRAADGEMFFGGINGYNVFDPEAVQENPFVPPLAWTKLTRAGRDLGLMEPFVEGKELQIPYKIGFVTLEFAALSYHAPERNQYAYRLAPRDEGWIDLGTGRSVSISSRLPGRYQLRVKAANPDGVWNEEGLEISVWIIPPFWRTGWFAGAAALFLITGALILVRMWRKLKAASAVASESLEKVVSKYRLTVREEEILRLVLEGAGNKDIEKKLFISASTVRNHIYNIYQKIGVKNRLELINQIGKNRL